MMKLASRSGAVFALVFVLTGFTFSYALIARAQTPTCNPACASGSTCEFTDLTDTNTSCQTASGATQVSEVVVTPTAKSATTASGATFATVVNNLVSILNSYMIPVLYALGFLYFLIGVARFAFAEGQENRAKARNMIIYGLIGLVVIFGVWGLVNLLLTVLTGSVGTGATGV
jgi:hypothetical protein